ncbi:general transcription factor 3C polypeptide 5 (transcription factor C subunit 1), partial [Tremellales sp. Uapishka_1]
MTDLGSSHEVLQTQASSSKAPYRHLPKHPYTSIEYPGTVSLPSALLKVINQDDINECFNAPISEAKVLEMRYREKDRNAVPVRGHRVASQKVLVRVVRKKRRKDGMQVDASCQPGQGPEGGPSSAEGVFTAEIVGPIIQTVRFRSMADWHYTPPQDGHVTRLVQSLYDLDYESILDYSFPSLDEHYIESVTPPEGGFGPSDLQFRSLLELQPTPMFSTRNIPPVNTFKLAPQTVEEDFYDERTGETRKRYVNKSRAVGFGVQTIGYQHAHGDVPLGPVDVVKQRMSKLSQEILEKLRRLLEARPVWMRSSLLSNFTEQEKSIIVNNKTYLPAVAYTFGAGPFWKTLIRFGYDPCANPDARFYQRVNFFVHVNRAKNRVLYSPASDEEALQKDDRKPPGWWQAEQEQRVQEGKRPPLDESKGHIFDGQILHRDRPDFQLCDLTDPLICKYVHDPSVPKEGWYHPQTMELIKSILRIKYMHVWETGEPAPDSLCDETILEYEDVMEKNGNAVSVAEENVKKLRKGKDKDRNWNVVPALNSGTEMAMKLANVKVRRKHKDLNRNGLEEGPGEDAEMEE